MKTLAEMGVDRDPLPGACDELAVGEWREGRVSQLLDPVAGEVAVAMVYNGISHAVMMATAMDLEDFALGFSLSEGIIERPEELRAVDVRRVGEGVQVDLEIGAERFHRLAERRRNLTGRTGCGLCGSESIEHALRSPPRMATTLSIDARAIEQAVAGLDGRQPLQRFTGATHGAAWCDPGGRIVELREDVGRHNALDKLHGALRRRGGRPEAGFVLVSSRASYEMVHKSASLGAEILVAVSAATSLAIAHARSAGMTLVGFARPGRFVVYTGAERIQGFR